MGGSVTGRYRLEYIIEDVSQKLARNERALQAHAATVGMGIGIDPGKARESHRAMLAQYRSMQRLGGALDAHGRRLRDTSSAVDRHTGSMANSTKQLQHWGLALRRMMLWWGSAALMIGAQKVVRSTLDIAGAFQYLVKELGIIGDEGEAVYRRLAASGYQAAIMTGRAFDEAADAMKAWVRQGYSAADVADLTRSTLIGLNLTEMSSIDLVRTMTAVMKAFDISARDSISIIDKLVGVSRKFAIETGQLAVGIRRFAASAEAANVTLEQQMGIMTAMMVGTQQNAQMVGRAGRTITTRMRRNAVDALETIAKVEVYTDRTRQTYRALWDVLSDLAATWGKLTEVEQEEIAFQAAGLRQREFFLTLMRDFDIAQKAHIEALASAGLAYRANLILVNTYQKAVAALRAEWERFMAMQTGLLDFFTNIVYGLRAMVRQLAALPEAAYVAVSALAALGGAALTFFGQPLFGVPLMAGGLLGLGAWELGKATRDLGNIAEQYKQVVEAQYQTVESTEKLAKEFINLFKAQEKGRQNTEQLALIRERLHELNPALISEEESFIQIYGVLTGKLDDLTEATRDAYKARQEFLITEKQLELARARGRLLEAKEEVPERLKRLPEEQYEATFNLLLKEQNTLLGEGLRITARKQDMQNRLAKAVTAERKAGFQVLMDEMDLDEERNKNKRDAVRDELAWLGAVVNADKEIIALEKELALLAQKPVKPIKPVIVERPEINLEKVKDHSEQITKELEIQRVLWQQAFEYTAKIEGREARRMALAVHLHVEAVKWLGAQLEAAQTMERQAAIMDKLVSYGPRSLKHEQLKLTVIQGFLRMGNAALDAVKRRSQEEADSHETSMSRLEQLQRMQNVWDKESARRIDRSMEMKGEAYAAERAQLQQIEAERIRLTQGAVAAAQYEYDQAKRKFDILSNMRQIDAVRELTQEAYLKLLDRETALRLATMSAEQRAADIREDNVEAEFKAQVRMVRMREGEIAAAELVLQRREDELDVLQHEHRLGEDRVRIEEKRAEVSAGRHDVEEARLARELDLDEKYKKLKEEERRIENQIRYEAIEREDDRAAAIQAEMDDIATKIALIQYEGDVEERRIELQELMNEKRRLEGQLIEENAKKEKGWLEQMEQALPQLISQAGQLVAGEIRGQTTGARIQGIAGLGAAFFTGQPAVSAGIVAVGSIMAALVDKQEDTIESLDLNTLALDRNTEMLNDIREAVIGGVASRFVWPAAVEHYGYPSLQGGGQVVRGGMAYVHPGEVRQPGPSTLQIIITGAGQNAEQITQRVMSEVQRQFGTDTRRGFTKPVYGMPR